MHPETDADRLTLLEDFGDQVTITPVSGGPAYQVLAIVDENPRESELDLGGDGASFEIAGTDPSFLARRIDVVNLEEGDLVDLPPKTGRRSRYRAHAPQADQGDADYVRVQLLEA